MEGVGRGVGWGWVGGGGGLDREHCILKFSMCNLNVCYVTSQHIPTLHY